MVHVLLWFKRFRSYIGNWTVKLVICEDFWKLVAIPHVCYSTNMGTSAAFNVPVFLFAYLFWNALVLSHPRFSQTREHANVDIYLNTSMKFCVSIWKRLSRGIKKYYGVFFHNFRCCDLRQPKWHLCQFCIVGYLRKSLLSPNKNISKLHHRISHHFRAEVWFRIMRKKT